MMRRFVQTGQNLVEFAIVAPVLFLFIFGIMESGWAFYVYSELTNAAREGARYAAVHGELCAQNPPCQMATTSTVRDHVVQRLSIPDAERVTVTLQGSLAPGEQVTVELSYPFRPLVGFAFPAGSITLRASSTMIVHY